MAERQVRRTSFFGKQCRNALVLLLALLLPVIAAAQDTEQDDETQLAVAQPELEADAGDETEDEDFRSGFGDIPAMGGPSGVAQELRELDRVRRYRFNGLQRQLDGWFAWKERVDQEHGLSLGFSTTLLFQQAGDALVEEDDAFGGLYRIQGNWVAAGRDTGHPGSVQFRVEYRARIGAHTAPVDLAADVGIASLNNAFGYSELLKLDASVLSWTQFFASQRVGLVLGRVDFGAYFDPYPYQTFATGFLNRGFVLNPTLAITGVGSLAGIAKGFVSDQFWVGGAFYDANAVNGEFDPDTFDWDELLKHVEIGWTPSYEQRRKTKVLLTYWEMDERVANRSPAGDGWALTINHELDNGMLPFLRAGSSNGGGGAPAEEAILVGFGWERENYDVFSLGVGWSDPSEKTFGPGLKSEKLLETSYRFQMSPNLSLLPNLQLIFDPANNPTEDLIWIIGLRVRLDI